MKRFAAIIAMIGLFTASSSSGGICLRCDGSACELVLLAEQPSEPPCCALTCPVAERPSRECCSFPEDKPQPQVCDISIENYQSLDHACEGRRFDHYFETVREDRRPHAPDQILLRDGADLAISTTTESTARRGGDHIPGVLPGLTTTVLRL